MIANANQVNQPVIAGSSATVVTDSCSPSNGVLDPGEGATLALCLQNVGTADVTTAVGTLQATGGVTNPSAPQVYGLLTAGGPPVCRNFTLTVAGLSCGADVVPTVQVQDGVTNLGNVSWALATGVPVIALSQNLDGVAAPALPAGWTSVSAAGVDSWTTVNTAPDTAPNAAFVNDPSTVSDTSLVTPNIVVPTTINPVVLSFRNSYALETGYDGGVLELKVGAGAFQDVIAAGGAFVAGGYNLTISPIDQNPLVGRQAWSGNSGGYITTTVTLPAAVSGQTMQLRWRRGTDQTVGGTGWRVDTVSLQAGRTCCITTTTADLAITKTDGQASYVPGQAMTYTIVASNGGPDAVVGATVADNFPADLTNVAWTCSATVGSACGSAGNAGNINTTVDLLNGGSATFVATATASLAAPGNISNTATVAAPGGVIDPVPGNNSATDTDSRLPSADLGITKTDGQTTTMPGQTIVYTIVASNPGPDAVVGATVSDTVPGTITGPTWTCVGAGGGTCAPIGSGNINATVNLPVGGTVTYTLTGTVNASAFGSLSNTATVTPPGGVTDPDPTDNSATDTDAVVGLDYYSLAPCRVVDTRGGAPIGGPVLLGQQTRTFAVAGNCAIPSTAKAISINVAVTQPTAAGNVRLFPAGQPVPTVSSINYGAGQTRANNAIVSLDGSGAMAAFVGQPAGTTVHAIIDVNGYFE